MIFGLFLFSLWSEINFLYGFLPGIFVFLYSLILLRKCYLMYPFNRGFVPDDGLCSFIQIVNFVFIVKFEHFGFYVLSTSSIARFEILDESYLLVVF